MQIMIGFRSRKHACTNLSSCSIVCQNKDFTTRTFKPCLISGRIEKLFNPSIFSADWARRFMSITSSSKEGRLDSWSFDLYQLNCSFFCSIFLNLLCGRLSDAIDKSMVTNPVALFFVNHFSLLFSMTPVCGRYVLKIRAHPVL